MVLLAAGSTLNSIATCFRSSFRTLERSPNTAGLPCPFAINEPINLAIEFAEPQFEMSPFGIRFGRETLPLLMIGAHIFGNHLRVPHLIFQPRKNCALDGLR